MRIKDLSRIETELNNEIDFIADVAFAENSPRRNRETFDSCREHGKNENDTTMHFALDERPSFKVVER